MRVLLATSVLALVFPVALGARTSRYEDKPLPLGIGPMSSSRIEPIFGKVARALSGKRTEVRCWSKLDWARINGEFITTGGVDENLDYVEGFYRPDTHRIHLAPGVCSGIVRLRYLLQHPTSGGNELEIAFGVETLTHESMHLRGFLDEATAECYAQQLVAKSAHLLGASGAYSRRLEALSWRVIYPNHPPQYLSPECRNDGALDLDPSSDRFP
jgi:hypothetical protein